jgi:hypothetical protein
MKAEMGENIREGVVFAVALHMVACHPASLSAAALFT